MDPKIAESHPSILNPGSKLAEILMTAPLITKVNKPKVRILIGSVKKINSGHMIELTTPITTEAPMAAKKPLTTKPGTREDVTRIATADTNQ